MPSPNPPWKRLGTPTMCFPNNLYTFAVIALAHMSVLLFYLCVYSSKLLLLFDIKKGEGFWVISKIQIAFPRFYSNFYLKVPLPDIWPKKNLGNVSKLWVHFFFLCILALYLWLRIRTGFMTFSLLYMYSPMDGFVILFLWSCAFAIYPRQC